MYPLTLTGLCGSNPLGAMAAFGLLRVIDEIPSFNQSRLAWTQMDDWQAVLFTPEATSREMLVSGLVERQKEIDLSPLNWSDDIRVAPSEYQDYLVHVAASASHRSRHCADWFSALGSELATDGSKGLVKPTHFHMTSGQMKFLKSLCELEKNLNTNGTEAFSEALFGPWRYEYMQYSLGLDPNAERIAALSDVAPTKVKPKSVGAAVWLAADSLPLFPTTVTERPRGVRLLTTGFSRRSRDWVFRWPVWEEPITLQTLKSLLAAEAIQFDHVDREALQLRGVSTVFQSVQYRVGQGYGVFRPATRVS